MKCALWDKDGVPERLIDLAKFTPTIRIPVLVRPTVSLFESDGVCTVTFQPPWENREYRYVGIINRVRIYRETT